jgi:hypothetical protein
VWLEVLRCFAASLADGGVDLVEVRLPRYAQVCAAAVVTQAYEALAWHRDRFGARRDEYALPSRIYLDAAAGYSPSIDPAPRRTGPTCPLPLQVPAPVAKAGR